MKSKKLENYVYIWGILVGAPFIYAFYIEGGGAGGGGAYTLLQYLQYGSKYRKYYVIILIVENSES